MLTHERDGSPASFPRLPDALRERFNADSLSLLPFGLDAGDLEINFQQSTRPLLVTQILARFTRDARGVELNADFFWGLPVGTRIECLLTIATAGGREQLLIPLRCPHEGCAQQVEVELTLAELSELQGRSVGVERFKVRCGPEELWVRKPTGSDQLAWLKRRFADTGEVLATMVETLVLDDAQESPVKPEQLDETWAEALDEALDEFDPLVNFSLMVRCPDCGVESLHEVDLEEFALGRLRFAQRQLLMTIHRLASHYHWSEGQIFSIPHWRRSHYLALIEKEDR